jgi:FkbM family methyltransferase
MKNKIFLKSNQEWTAFIEINLRDTYCKNNIKPGMNVVDIGAHIGSYALMASEKTGAGGKIIAVEPEAENYKNLLENINLNNLENVIPVNIALSDRDGQEKLYINSQSTCHSLSPDNGQAAATAFVKTKTLDSLLKELKIEKIDIIKIDTEGWETHILKGALETLKNNPKAKLFIASYHYPGETEEVQNFLQKMGFNTKIRYADIIVTA